MGRVISPEEAARLAIEVHPLAVGHRLRIPAEPTIPTAARPAPADDVAAEVQRLRSLVRELAVQVRAERAAAHEQAQRDAVYLGAEIAKRVLGEAAQRDEQLIVRTALDALQQLKGPEQVTIRANPEDAELLTRALSEGESSAAAVPMPFSVVGDSAVACGGCLIEADEGVLDATLSGQVDTIVRAMLEEVTERR